MSLLPVTPPRHSSLTCISYNQQHSLPTLTTTLLPLQHSPNTTNNTHTATMLPHRARVVSRGPRLAAAVTRLVPARAAGSVPRFQAQVVSDINANTNTANNMPPPPPPRFDTSVIPAARERPPSASASASAHPVSTALFQNQEEFWRKVPVWRDVSAREFLSYSWTVSGPQCVGPLLLMVHC